MWPEKGTCVLFNPSLLGMELVSTSYFVSAHVLAGDFSEAAQGSPVLTGLCGLPSGSLLEEMLPVPYFENLLGLREEGLLAQCCL